ncbi:MAG: cytochrome P450 [Akkermansiaceae bacterium]
MKTSEEFTGKLVDTPWFHRQWMLAGNPALFIDRLIKEHGDFVRCRGLIDFHLINDPHLVREVMKSTMRDFDKNSRIYNHFRNVFGNGLVTAEGETWKRKRKLMQPMFSPSSIGTYFDLMLSSSISTAEKIADSEPFDMAEEMNHLALEIAGRAFFSDSFDGSIERIREWTEAINCYSAKPPVPLVSDLRFPSPTNLRVRRMMKDFRDFMRSLIQSRSTSTPKDDLLDVILSARDEDGEKMDEDEVCEEILGMIIGGHETAATAMTWLWHDLDHHPDVEQKVLDEIEQVVGNETLTPKHLRDLKYTNQVIQETMRLHPPFWFENRNTISDVELGGATVPRGSMVVFSRYSLQRHPDFWKDPHSYNPDRFDPENTENPGATCAHIPFGGGPRICIGRHFAMMELLVITVTILQRLKVSVHSSDRHRLSAKLTMAPRHGLKCITQKRS